MRKLFVRQPVACSGSLRFALAVALFLLVLIFRLPANAQVTIAQLSDTHLGEGNSPHAEENLRRAVDMINERHPDAVVLSGDIGENPEQWQRARQILKGLKVPIYYAPGNHDVHSNDIAQYRRVFGPDYYSFHVKGVTFLVIDSQLFGNYDQFGLQTLAPLSSQNQAEAEKMLAWLANPDLRQDSDNRGRHGDAAQNNDRQNNDRQNNDGQGRNGDNGRKIIIGIQHIPVFRAENLIPDPKPYWVINEPYRSREMALAAPTRSQTHAGRSLACGRRF